jgi:hypothetical protein
MKFFLSLLFILVWKLPLAAQESNPNYFHDLRGFEDSSATTQLFYRIYEPDIRECSYEENGETYINSSDLYKNHLYNLDTETLSDSIFLKAQSQTRPICEVLPTNLEQFIFLDNGFSKPISIYRSIYGLNGSTVLKTYDDHIFELGIDNPLGLNYQKTTNSLIVTSPSEDLVIKSLPDYNPILKKSYRFPLDKDSLWDGKSYYDDYPDSLLIDFSVLGIVEYDEDIFIGFKDSSLVISYDSGETSEVIINNFFEEYPYFGTSFEPLIIDPSSPVFYLRNNKDYIRNGITYDIIRVKRFGTFNDYVWEDDELLKDSNKKRISIDASNSGHLYLSDTTRVFFSEDYGETMQEILEFEEEVTGLYKKPNSDILYVLTKNNLFEVENGQATSIKQVPISREPEPEIPEQITLHQNFPNPFNPTTTIQFQLDKATFTKLTIYDVLGRKVRELVNEVRPVGTNTIQFDATNLASGVYLYRLEANGVVQTKRLTLIK